MPVKAKPLGELFWAKVAKSDGCWTWTAARYPRGYGFIGKPGTRGQKKLYAHRVSWELHHGPIPEGMLVCHRCDNPPCVRPDHLFLGTVSDNTDDMLSKRRSNPPRGTTHYRAKLDEGSVRAIRAAAESGIRGIELATRYGVSSQTISKIVARWSWAHVD